MSPIAVVVVVIVFVQITSANHLDALGFAESDRHQPRNVRLRYVRNEKCRNEIIHLMDGLKENSPWAVRMHRSSSGYPTGLLHGNNYQFDGYDECTAARSPDGLVRGKYCMVEVRVSPRTNRYPSGDDFDLRYNPHESFLEKFKVTADPSKKPRNIIHTGLCIPENCSPDDISTLGGFIRDTADSFGYNTTVTLTPKSCTDPETSNIGERIFWGVVTVLLNLVVLSTIWDVSGTRKDKLPIIVQSFSLKRNLSKLTRHGDNEEFDAFHGMKTLSMVLIILGHRCMASFGGPVLNADFLEEGYRSFPTILLLNGFLIVDTFFLIGGFLTFITLHKTCKKGSEVSTLAVCINRWLRITPGYMLMVFFYGYAMEGLGTGPLWSAKVGREAERCRTNWWTNFLCVNNYINVESLCMFQSWYVACDMHYTIISPIVVALVTRAGRRGFLLLIASVLAFSATVSGVTYINRYDGIMRIYHGAFEDLASDSFFTQMYVKSHYRIIPYLSGMASAYIYLHLKESDYRLTRIMLWVSSVMALIFGIASICGAWVFYIPGRKYYTIENSLYASLHRVVWSVCIGWIAIASSRKSFGKLQPILTAKAYIPFSRLSFSTFLVHGAVQLYTTASLREPEYISYPKLFWMTGGDIVLSFLFAFLLHLLVEAPMKGIQQLLFTKTVFKNGRN